MGAVEQEGSQSDTLLRTKLFVPKPRGDLIRRQRLINLLQNALLVENQFTRKLTLISAPAGYGKTTLASQWLEDVEVPVGWLSLEQSENDPTRFLTYLVAAIQTISPHLGQSVAVMLQSPQPPPQNSILTALLNELTAFEAPFILGIDDYHVIQSQPVHEILNFLVEHLPTDVHFVITSREDPPLPLHRLQARRQMISVRQAELTFDVDEVRDYFKSTSGTTLTAAQASSLARRTEGWVTGLQLAALSIRAAPDLDAFIKSFTGSNRYILDYLFEEVFNQQSEEIQSFLLQTSILERFCADLVHAVTGNENSRSLLEQFEQSNLFLIPLDQSRTWYRYHRLFGDLLLNRLRAEGESAENNLHQLASQWFEANDYIPQAIHHSLSAESWERATALIGQAADSLLKRGELLTLINWCKKIPIALIRKDPDFGLSYAWALLLTGRFDEANELLAHFEALAANIPELLGQVATAQAYAARAHGENKKVIEKSELALRLLPESEVTSRSTLSMNLGLVYWHRGRLREAAPVLNDALEMASVAGNHYAGLTAQIFLARTQASQGSLKQAEVMLRKTIEIGGDIPIVVLSHYDLSCIYYEWNDLEKAWEHLNQGLDICTRSGNLEFQNGGHIQKAYLLMAQGKTLGAFSEIETSHALSQHFGPASQARSMACHAEIALAIGDVKTAEHWIEQMPEDVDGHSLYRFIGLAHIRLLLAKNQKDAARAILSELLDRASTAGWGYATVAIRALRVRASKSDQEAIDLLSEALKLSHPEGFIRTYVEAGSALIPLLKEVAHRGTEPVYAGQILEAYDDKLEKARLPLIEPLSAREIEVVRLLAAGFSNREIAEQLVISLGTAKSHVHNICGKLGVRNRTEAAMKAKEQNLV